MKILVDMNLSPGWVPVLERHGWPTVHWSTVGNPGATDAVIMHWARVNGYVVFTHDLDFGTLLALTHNQGPSVIQARTQDTLPTHLESLVAAAITQNQSELESGALVVVDESRCRVRVLPL